MLTGSDLLAAVEPAREGHHLVTTFGLMIYLGQGLATVEFPCCLGSAVEGVKMTSRPGWVVCRTCGEHHGWGMMLAWRVGQEALTPTLVRAWADRYSTMTGREEPFTGAEPLELELALLELVGELFAATKLGPQ